MNLSTSIEPSLINYISDFINITTLSDVWSWCSISVVFRTYIVRVNTY